MTRPPIVPARVNGELLSRPRQQQPEHYEQDVDWLLNDAPGLLGEVGVSYAEPIGGTRVVVDTGPYHARMHRALWAVAKYRRLHVTWRALDASTRAVLVARYAQRRWPEMFVAHFGELVGVVVHLHQGDQRLTKAARQPAKANAAEALADALRVAQSASREAHRAWRRQQRATADKELEHG